MSAHDEDEHHGDEPEEDERSSDVERDLRDLVADEVRRRTEAPLPRSLIEFLR